MTSKRTLEAELEAEVELRRRAVDAKNRADAAAHAMKSALVRVAKHFGFYDAYVREERYLVERHDGYPPENQPTGYRNVFSPDALIADLDAIDQARSADEARARLGIKEEA
ncbi:hypothetical protein GCM10010910_01170 [Microbacterium nanhaiense]|uniref:Uncharacterized protein n=1 Tax=Microbacterium nanhaiense TaxID=1301026 RepID=A0ABQ2MWI5_9MICO|nr:hypothetical protein [Microbacterium nanhaiense]GGO59081.1 hypothetical protein GCM10010910_01170 [Microbacterium nanhaiense]